MNDVHLRSGFSASGISQSKSRNTNLKRHRWKPVNRQTSVATNMYIRSFFCWARVAPPFHLPTKTYQTTHLRFIAVCLIFNSIQNSWKLRNQEFSAIMGVKPKIAPSMLSSDFANLASEAHRMLNFGADWLHMDIMVCFQNFYCSHRVFVCFRLI